MKNMGGVALCVPLPFLNMPYLKQMRQGVRPMLLACCGLTDLISPLHLFKPLHFGVAWYRFEEGPVHTYTTSDDEFFSTATDSEPLNNPSINGNAIIIISLFIVISDVSYFSNNRPYNPGKQNRQEPVSERCFRNRIIHVVIIMRLGRERTAFIYGCDEEHSE